MNLPGLNEHMTEVRRLNCLEHNSDFLDIIVNIISRKQKAPK
jgi:hypothetical protein